MPYKLTRNPNHIVQVHAHLEPEAVEAERNKIATTFRHKARVPGFRPGKAPMAAVRARFGEEIQEELQEHLGSLLWQEVVDDDEKLDPLTKPTYKEMGFGDDGGFSFTAEMEVRPEYELPGLDGVELPEHALEVSAVEIDAELEKLQEEHASWEPADDQQAVDGMLVEADLHGIRDDGEEPYDEENARFVLGVAGVPEQINEALQGAKAGETRTAEKRFPDDDENQERAGKSVTYTVNVKSLKTKVLPPVDDELAQTVGLDSADQLKERVREMIQQNKLAERRQTWRRHILDHLENGIDVNELPASLVQSAVSEELHRFAYSMAMQGVDPKSGDVDWQELSAKFEPGARRKVLDTLVLEKLADELEVEVPENEVDAHVAVEAQRLGVPPAEHKANMAKEGQLGHLRHAARISATVDQLIGNCGGEVG